MFFHIVGHRNILYDRNVRIERSSFKNVNKFDLDSQSKFGSTIENDEHPMESMKMNDSSSDGDNRIVQALNDTNKEGKEKKFHQSMFSQLFFISFRLVGDRSNSTSVHQLNESLDANVTIQQSGFDISDPMFPNTSKFLAAD